MRISEAQRLISRTYYERDAGRGLSQTFMWLVEEVGELSRALRKGDAEALEGEFADVLAWFLSVAEIAGVDAEKAFLAKYGDGCPACGCVPCECPPRPFASGEGGRWRGE